MKRIKADAAPYPANNTKEIQAVLYFLGGLDVNAIKPDVKFYDKVPNTDGIITVVRPDQVPIGKLEVQIKVLDKKNVTVPKYQCHEKFLAFCEESLLPVLLVAVDIDKRWSYWHHFDDATILRLAKKIKKQSVSFKFDIKRKIESGKTDYVQDWIDVINSYKNKLFNFDQLSAKIKVLEKENAALKTLPEKRLVKSDRRYKQIHIFLDHYNGLLAFEFKTIKNLLYPSYWKIGLGFSRYQDKALSYILYPIRYEENEPLIKHLNDSQIFALPKVLAYVGHNVINPIKHEARKYAYERIQSDVTKVLDNYKFLVPDETLAREYLVAFLDRFHLVLGLANKAARYALDELDYGLSIFLPFWIEQVVHPDDPYYKMSDSEFIIESIYRFTSKDEIAKKSATVRDQLRNGAAHHDRINIGSEDYSLPTIVAFSEFLRKKGIDQIERIYETKHPVTKQAYFSWEAWGDQKTRNNLKLLYNHLPKIYDKVLNTYFPQLNDRLQFYADFNLLIVKVDYSQMAVTHTPSLLLYYFQSEQPAPGRTIIVENDQDFPEIQRDNWFELSRAGFTNEGQHYRLKRSDFGAMKFIYDETPLALAINKLLGDRLTEYLKNTQEGKKK